MSLQQINQLTALEGECSRLRIQVQQKDDELYNLRRQGSPVQDNSHYLTIQREQEIEETKKRFALYVEKNAELQAEVEMLRTTKRQSGDDYSIHSNTDKDQLIHRYRVENRRLQQENLELQNFMKLSQNEVRQLKGKGCTSYMCS